MRALLKWIAQRRRPTRSVLVVKRVWIDKNECLAHSLCVSEAEGLIEYSDEESAAVVKEDALQRTQQELMLLLKTSHVCPMSALFLETENGRVLNLDDDEVQRAIEAGTYRWA